MAKPQNNRIRRIKPLIEKLTFQSSDSECSELNYNTAMESNSNFSDSTAQDSFIKQEYEPTNEDSCNVEILFKHDNDDIDTDNPFENIQIEDTRTIQEFKIEKDLTSVIPKNESDGNETNEETNPNQFLNLSKKTKTAGKSPPPKSKGKSSGSKESDWDNSKSDSESDASESSSKKSLEQASSLRSPSSNNDSIDSKEEFDNGSVAQKRKANMALTQKKGADLPTDSQVQDKRRKSDKELHSGTKRKRSEHGPRRGRGGVRGRGGTATPEVEEAVNRGGPSGAGRGRGVRGGRGEPRTIQELVIRDISELPEDEALETALHPKRMRVWQPSNPPPSHQQESVPSPAMSSARSPMRHLPPPPRPHVRDENIADLINYGSEDDSGDSDGEEAIGYPVVIPRAFQSAMETPLDLDIDQVEAEPADLAPAGVDVPLSATEQPWSCYQFEWKKFPDVLIAPASRRETFSEINVGPTTPRDDPYAIFIDIWDRQIMEHIASETNKYAQQVAAQMLENRTLQPSSRITRWRDTTVDELYSYFGITLAMGIVVKSRIEEYWASTPDIFYTPGFSAHMSIDRFLLLNTCLHFNDNSNMCAQELSYSEAKLYKVEPILTHLNLKFQELYTPAQNIALDESLLMWKGCLEISQLIPNKAAKKGIKSYEICESQTGYLWRFEIHAHRITPSQDSQAIEDPLEASTPSIVLRLTEGLQNKGYCLWMDNFYNSPCLARRLKSWGFDCVGTLRTDRKFVPQALHSLTKRDMRPGQIAGLTSGDVDVMVWRDTNRVAMISTYHGHGQHTARGSTKPILILDYNIMMGGVDKKDQLLSMYPVERKRTKVWYKKLFRRLLNVSVLNAYIIHRHTSSLSHRNFRICLIKSLLSKHSSSSLLPPAPRQNQRVDITHRLAEFPMRNHQRMRRNCAVCKKLVRTFCVGCGKSVCMDPCFVTIHS